MLPSTAKEADTERPSDLPGPHGKPKTEAGLEAINAQPADHASPTTVFVS